MRFGLLFGRTSLVESIRARWGSKWICRWLQHTRLRLYARATDCVAVLRFRGRPRSSASRAPNKSILSITFSAPFARARTDHPSAEAAVNAWGIWVWGLGQRQTMNDEAASVGPLPCCSVARSVVCCQSSVGRWTWGRAVGEDRTAKHAKHAKVGRADIGFEAAAGVGPHAGLYSFSPCDHRDPVLR